MSDQDNDDFMNEADEREQITAAMLVSLFDADDLKIFTEKMPFSDAEEMFTELHQSAVDKVIALNEQERAEFISDLLAEMNWNYIINDMLNEASEAGLYRDGETRLLKDEPAA